MKPERTAERLCGDRDDLMRAARDLGHELPRNRGPVIADFVGLTARLPPAPNDWAAGFRAGLVEVAVAAEAATPQQHRACFLPRPALLTLDLMCGAIRWAYDATPYLVGSCLKRPDYRDVDVRLILEDHRGIVGDPRTLIEVAISSWLSTGTGLPIDFQFQTTTEAAAEAKGERHALAMGRLAP